MSLLVTATGEPAPPQDIVAKLRAISPRLSLKWVDSYWGLMIDWSETDERRQLVRRGVVPESSARDLLAMLPRDCPVRAAHDFFVNACRSYGGSNKDEVRKLLDRIDYWNEAQAERNTEPLVDYTAELVSTNAPTLLGDEGKRAPRVYQTKGKTPKRKVTVE